MAPDAHRPPALAVPPPRREGSATIGTLASDTLRLRLVAPTELEELHGRMSDLRSRGAWFPLGQASWTDFEQQYHQHGLWSEHEGMLVMDAAGVMVGEIEFFPLSQYLPGYELSYLVFDEQHRGRGHATTAVRLLRDHLFATRRVGRLQLVIHPDNAASQQVARRSGFELEGTLRAAWFARGTFHDVQVWSAVGPLATAPPTRPTPPPEDRP